MNELVLVCEVQECSMAYIDRAKCIIVQNTSKLTTTACFIQGESSGGRPPW